SRIRSTKNIAARIATGALLVAVENHEGCACHRGDWNSFDRFEHPFFIFKAHALDWILGGQFCWWGEFHHQVEFHHQPAAAIKLQRISCLSISIDISESPDERSLDTSHPRIGARHLRCADVRKT